MFIKTILSTCILSLCCSLIYAQHIPRVGSPFVQQYNKSAYHAGNQNWGLSISPEGFIYAANTEGLLSFDGQEWRLYSMPRHSSLRSVLVHTDGKIYVGGAGEFGFWTRSKFGKMNYSSISDSVKNKELLRNDDIWRIIIDQDAIYFHAFSKSYRYQNGKIETITAQGEPFLFGHQVRNNIYFEQIPSGLHQLNGKQLKRIPDASKLQQANILSMLPFGKDQTLIATANNGLFLMNPSGEISSWSVQADDELKRFQINNAVKLFSDQYAFGTIQNGIYILNSQGETIQHINKNNGLQNNTVLSMAVDKQANLWAGLDNGIDRIDINSPLYYFSDLTVNIGTVYSSIIYNNRIYLGTNQGLFYSDWKGVSNYQSLKFSIIPGSQGQVWQLANIAGKLIIGHNSGTFELTNNSLKRISNVTGAWRFLQIINTNYWLQGNYTGLGLMQAREEIAFLKQFQNRKEPIREILQDGPNNFWLTNQQHVYNLNLGASYEEVKDWKDFSNGLPKDARVHGVYNLANNTVFATDSGFYRFDNVSNEFKAYDELNSKLGSFSNANKVIPIQDKEYWLIKKSHIAKIEFPNDGNLRIDSSSWNSLKGRMMNNYEHILNVNKDLSLIGLDNGFALYFNQYPASKQIPKPIITNLWNITSDPSAIVDEMKIPNSQNNIRIAYASPWYSSAPVQYQYLLEGYTDEWSTWDQVAYRDFTNLPFGKYTFKVRTMTANGIQSEISSFSFRIQAPWYFSWPMIILYVLLALAFIYLFRKNYERRLLEHQRKIKDKVLAEHEERMAREAEENERKLMALKNQQLEQELEIKNRELANAAMNIVYKNEMLNNLHHELTNLNDSNGNKLSNEQLRKVNKLIDEAHSDDRDWDLFEKSFNEAHENFFKKLKTDYPELVPNDLKLCAYLRLNMSSKEIASLLNISTRGVEIRRYRLRKKLALPTSKNLTEFLLEL